MSSGQPVQVSEKHDELRRQTLAALAAYPLTRACREALQEMQSESEPTVDSARKRAA